MSIEKKGMIALDIDGTITAEKHHLSEKVSAFLNEIGKEWQLFFLTGRSFSFTRPILSTLTVPYYLAVQNGAALYRNSGEELIVRRYISITYLPLIEEIVCANKSGVLLEVGEKEGDRVFYKPKDYNKEGLAYIDYRRSFFPEEWIGCDDFTLLSLQEFALGKVLTFKEEASLIHQRIEKEMGDRITSLILHDPWRPQGYIVHMNALGATKKDGLLSIWNEVKSGTLITAGDDANDFGMLMASDIKVVMEDAPLALRAIADVIAPSAKNEGIIEGIRRAIELV